MSESVGPSRPLHLRIVDVLRDRIASGELPPGAKLPSNRELMDEFRVSSHSTQQAVRILKSEGLLEGLPGKGVYVRRGRQLISKSAVDLAAESARGPKTQIRLDGLREIEPPAEVAEALGLDVVELVFVRSQVVIVDDEPVEILVEYFPRAVAGGTPLAGGAPLLDGSLAELERLGYELDHAVDLVQTRPPAPEEARTLRLTPGTSVFRVLRTVYTVEGRAVEVVDMTLGGDRYQLRYKLPIHG